MRFFTREALYQLSNKILGKLTRNVLFAVGIGADDGAGVVTSIALQLQNKIFKVLLEESCHF